jgi:hypothetical protein
MRDSVLINVEGLLSPEKSLCQGHFVFKGGKFRPNEQEISRFRQIDRLGVPYIIVNVEKSRDVCRRVLERGFTDRWKDKVGTVHEVHYRVVDGWTRNGDGGTYILFVDGDAQAPQTPDEFKAALGRRGVFSAVEDDLKFEKYWKRELAPYMASVSGRIIEWLPDGFVALFVNGWDEKGVLNVRKTFVRTPEAAKQHEPLVDGSLKVSPGFMSFVLGREVKDGEGFAGHLSAPNKYFKGVMEALKTLRWDVVAFMGKKQLVTVGDVVSFTVLTELHVSPIVYSDVQSICALDYADQLPGFALAAMEEFSGALSDEKKMRELISNVKISLRAAAEREGVAVDEELQADMARDEQAASDEPVWSMVQLYDAQLPLTSMPASRRRLLRFFEERVVNMSKFRVPLPSWAMRRYLAVDRTVFDVDGNIVVEKAALKGCEIVVPGCRQVGPAALQRQPIANAAEQAFGELVRHIDYEALSDSPFVYLSASMILKGALEQLGGGDLDDPSIVRTLFSEVKRLYGLFVAAREQKSQAVAELERKQSEAAAVAETAEVSEDLDSDDPFASRRLARQAAKAKSDPLGRMRRLANTLVGPKRNSLSIGKTSNYIMVDLANCNNGWYERPMLTLASGNLEAVIDSNQHVLKADDGSFSVKAISQELATFEETVPVCEEVLVHRLPEDVRKRVPLRAGKLTQVRRKVERTIKQWQRDLDIESLERLGDAVPQWLPYVQESREAVKMVREMRAFIDAARLQLEPVVLKDVLAEFKADGMDLDNPDVQAKAQAKAGVRVFKTLEESLFARYNEKPGRKQAVACWLKQCWCNAEQISVSATRKGDGTGYLFGNHTVAWVIEAWLALNGEMPADGYDVLGALEVVRGEAKRTEVKYEPVTVLDAVTVAAGWQRRGFAVDSPEVVAWKGHAGEMVTLHLVDNGKWQTYEVRLMDGTLYGTVLPSEMGLVDGRETGWLRVHPDAKKAYAMQVAFGEPGDNPGSKGDVFPVVAGLSAQYGDPMHPAVVAFCDMAGTEVETQPCLHLNVETGEFEDAVAVMRAGCSVDGDCITEEELPEEHLLGFVPRGEVARCLRLGNRQGVLAPGGDFSLRVVLN